MQMSLDLEIYKHVAFNKLLGEWEPKEKKEGKKSGELLGVSAAWKKNGSVIFASTDVGAEKYVAVWAIDKSGLVGRIVEDEDGSTRTQIRIRSESPMDQDLTWLTILMLLHAASCCFMLLHAASCCFMLLHAASCCFMLLHAASCCLRFPLFFFPSLSSCQDPVPRTQRLRRSGWCHSLL